VIIQCGKRRDKRFKHGMTDTPEWRVWRNMLQRCTNPNNKLFHRYGGRGIVVCEQWFEFENFFRDMGRVPAGMTLDRIDNNGDYSRENCRWASRQTQNNNRESNLVITLGRETLTASQWSRRTGIPASTIARRARLGWSPEKILTDKAHIKHRKVGSENSQARLNEDQVLVIRLGLKAGRTQKSIAKEFNVSVKTISAIKTRVIWRHI